MTKPRKPLARDHVRAATVLPLYPGERALIERHIDMSDGAQLCWPWTGSLDNWGQPRVARRNAKGRQVQLSGRRRYWHLLYGPLPRYRFLVMSCGRKDCMNPSHMEPRRWDEVTHPKEATTRPGSSIQED